MGLPALRGLLQSPSLQVNIEVTLAACKPEKTDAGVEAVPVIFICDCLKSSKSHQGKSWSETLQTLDL